MSACLLGVYTKVFTYCQNLTSNTYCNYLRQGGYVFASVSLCVCVCVCVCVSLCLCVINITQKVTDQFLRKF